MKNTDQPRLWTDLTAVETVAIQGGSLMFGVPLFGPFSGSNGQDDSFRLIQENGETQILLAGRSLLPTKAMSGLTGQKVASSSSSISQTLASLALPI